MPVGDLVLSGEQLYMYMFNAQLDYAPLPWRPLTTVMLDADMCVCTYAEPPSSFVRPVVVMVPATRK